MSLTYNDLQEIRKVVEETVDPTKGGLKALGNDIKEIYSMIAGGLGGYAYGKNKATAEAQKAAQQKTASAQSDLNKAGAVAGNELEESQQTVKTLQNENATLKQTISDQTKKITDLEKQLEEAKQADTTPTESQ